MFAQDIRGIRDFALFKIIEQNRAQLPDSREGMHGVAAAVKIYSRRLLMAPSGALAQSPEFLVPAHPHFVDCIHGDTLASERK